MIIVYGMSLAFIIFMTWGVCDLFECRGTCYWKPKHIIKDISIKTLSGLGISVLVGVALFFCVAIGTAMATPHQRAEITNSIEIYSLKDNVNNTTKTGFIGRTVIKNELKYIYIIEGPQGMQLKSIGVEHTYIIQDNTKKPHVETWRREYTNKVCNHLFLIKGINDGVDTVFYIPEGSILTMDEYIIDLQ